MITILILDDDTSVLEKERTLTEEYFQHKGLDCKVTVSGNAQWIYGGITEERYDIYVLDIEMPEKSGLDIAHEIRKHYPEPIFIFVTNYIEYTMAAFEVETYRYISKDTLSEKLPAAYDSLIPRLWEREEHCYTIAKKAHLEKIPYREIYYLKKDSRYTVLVHRYGESRVRKSLADVFEELHSQLFIYIDKGYVVNMQNVQRMKERTIWLYNGTRLPIGLPRLRQVREKLSWYWGC